MDRVFFLIGAAAIAGAPSRTSASTTAIVERITLPPCALPRTLRGSGEEPCVAVLWRAGLLWPGTFRTAGGYGKNLETLEE